MTPLETLTQARALIENRDNWTTAQLSNENGCLCTLGAVAVAAGMVRRDTLVEYALSMDNSVLDAQDLYDQLDENEAVKLLASVVKHKFDPEDSFDTSQYVFLINDNSQHCDVMEMFDSAIAKAANL